MELELAGKIAAIVIIDLVLSGDNAMVIGMASRGLSPQNRKRAILIGGLGAVMLRVIFTAMAALLLDIPLLQASGALLLIGISFKLVKPARHGGQITEAESLMTAIKTIILADVVMSLDNILAVGGAAHGDLKLLIFGLLLSIPILLAGSSLVARLLGRFPILVYAGVVVLIITAVRMFFEDKVVHARFDAPTALIVALSAGLSAIVIGWSFWQTRHIVDGYSEIAEVLLADDLLAVSIDAYPPSQEPSLTGNGAGSAAAISQSSVTIRPRRKSTG